jgi:hypothetical protein
MRAFACHPSRASGTDTARGTRDKHMRLLQAICHVTNASAVIEQQVLLAKRISHRFCPGYQPWSENKLAARHGGQCSEKQVPGISVAASYDYPFEVSVFDGLKIGMFGTSLFDQISCRAGGSGCGLNPPKTPSNSSSLSC